MIDQSGIETPHRARRWFIGLILLSWIVDALLRQGPMSALLAAGFAVSWLLVLIHADNRLRRPVSTWVRVVLFSGAVAATSLWGGAHPDTISVWIWAVLSLAAVVWAIWYEHLRRDETRLRDKSELPT